jgi:hypothetical protein
MLARVRAVAAHHLRQLSEAGERGKVERDLAQRRLEGIHPGGGQAEQMDAMRGAEQHHATDDRRAPPSEQGIGVCCHRAAVFVAGMRGDQQLRWRSRGIVVGPDAGQVARDLRAQRIARGGIEQAIDDGAAYGRH